ncbi:hypothetical protein [Tunturibacter empetritectus]|uniref:Uncharacterized protein n=1 Tax=Tunturiibacter lichenicola TaxID=2051959 RepID=A0A7W8JBJ4_9BACT|nr:hypothetical protein [Edaphobacter lichenicola]MBB5346282.1 hypothetical protein [Edaphobacter lichenicola]
MNSAVNFNSLETLDQEDLLKLVKSMISGGVFLNFHGKRSAMEIAKRVRPRVTRRITELHCGTPEQQSKNMIIEGRSRHLDWILVGYPARDFCN